MDDILVGGGGGGREVWREGGKASRKRERGKESWEQASACRLDLYELGVRGYLGRRACHGRVQGEAGGGV